MTNLEHLVENGIVLLEKDGTTYDRWIDVMSKDCNWQGNEHITIQDLWQICQYVVYTYKISIGNSTPVPIEEYDEGFNDGYATAIKNVPEYRKLAGKLQRPQGEWIVTVDKYNIQTCKCSICGRIEVISHYDFDKIPFCHCGADMRGDKND